MLRTQIQFQRPGGRMLVCEMPISLRHVIWIELRFATDGRDTRRPITPSTTTCATCTPRGQSSRERLHQATQSELRAAKGQPAAATHTGSRAGKDHRALPCGDHVGRRLLCANETA